MFYLPALGPMSCCSTGEEPFYRKIMSDDGGICCLYHTLYHPESTDLIKCWNGQLNAECACQLRVNTLRRRWCPTVYCMPWIRTFHVVLFPKIVETTWVWKPKTRSRSDFTYHHFQWLNVEFGYPILYKFGLCSVRSSVPKMGLLQSGDTSIGLFDYKAACIF